jgi:bifunctional DNA-binding transcriptional regulator/antitoxin component of YhaV-PrlF toxin-antitoxin module
MPEAVPQRFQTTIELGGKTATGMEVPVAVVEALGAGKRPAVRVTLAGYTYRSTVAPMGGRFLLPVSAQVREGAGVAAGDRVEVEVVLDTEPRELTLPSDFEVALHAAPDAARAFESLSYSNKRRLVLPIEDAKTEETRQRRIQKAVAELRGGG